MLLCKQRKDRAPVFIDIICKSDIYEGWLNSNSIAEVGETGVRFESVEVSLVRQKARVARPLNYISDYIEEQKFMAIAAWTVHAMGQRNDRRLSNQHMLGSVGHVPLKRITIASAILADCQSLIDHLFLR